jgi:CheY-specific phosphatase CheX
MDAVEGLSAAAVEEILKDVFSTMINLPLETAPGAPPVAQPSATAIIGLIGKPGKLVVLRACERLACRIAGGMLMAEYAAWSDEVRDAFSELANMTAGNIKAKCFTGDGFSLSLPTVIFGGDYTMSSARMRTVLEMSLASGGGILRVTVAEEI